MAEEVGELVDGELLPEQSDVGHGLLQVVVAIRDGHVFDDVTRMKNV